MIRFFTYHPTAANLLALILLIGGAVSLPLLKRETFPDVSKVVAEVSVAYPGATPEEIEQTIIRRIEDALESVVDIAEIKATAQNGMGSVTVEMSDEGEATTFLSDVRTEIDAIDDLPADIEKPIIRQLNRTDRVVSIAVVGPMPLPHLKEYAEDIKVRLTRLPEVSQIKLDGFSDRQLRIEISQAKLMQFGLGVNEIADVIKAQSVDLPTGNVETREREIVVRFSDERRTPRDFESLVVVAEPGKGVVRLGDIATITDTFEEDWKRVDYNGQRAALLQVEKTKAEDSLNALAAIEAFVEQENAAAPPGVKLVLTEDISSVVADRLRLLTNNGMVGLVLVFLTMWAFFSLRYSFWVAAGLPVAFAGAIWGMYLVGLSINMLTMVGLLISLGLIMDDSIVIAENIASFFEKGEDAWEAALKGTGQVFIGILSSFATTTVVFGPLMYLEGDIGKVLRVMPMVLILTLLISLIEAFLILPHHLGHALHQSRDDKPGYFRRGIDGALDWFRDQVLEPAVRACVVARYLFLGGCVFIFLAGIALIAGGIVKFTSFPDVEGNVMVARITLPQGTPIEKTEAAVEQIQDALRQLNEEYKPLQPARQDLIESVFVHYGENATAGEIGPHVATVSTDLLNSEVREGETLDRLLARWRKLTGSIPGILELEFAEPAFGPAGRAFEVRISGEDLERLKEAALDVQRELASYQGPTDISDNLRRGQQEILVRLREGSYGLGLTAQSVASQLRSALLGRVAQEVQVKAESFEIEIRLPEEDRNSLGALEKLYITLPNGKLVPLLSVVTAETNRGWARISRIDGRRTVNVLANLDPALGNTTQILIDMSQNYFPEWQKRYPDLNYNLAGEAEETITAGASMARALLIGVIGVFVLLSFQFRGYIEPLIVMGAIPLALVGVILGHLLLGYDLTMPSMMGFASLAGIVVNDSILLVVFIKLRLEEGLSLNDATAMASRDRFRAVLLTSLTTIVGLLPLLAEQSLQAQVLIPLAISICFGLATTTVLVLLAIPVFYALVQDLKNG